MENKKLHLIKKEDYNQTTKDVSRILTTKHHIVITNGESIRDTRIIEVKGKCSKSVYYATQTIVKYVAGHGQITLPFKYWDSYKEITDYFNKVLEYGNGRSLELHW